MRLTTWTLAGVLALGAAPAAHGQARTSPARPAVLPAWVGDHPRFGWSGGWLFPVGSPYEIGRPGPEGSPAYRINRCIGGPDEGGGRHQGADLSCGHGGDLVHAAGHGLVVRAEAHGWNGGYGRHVVIAHRLVDGGLVYSVYAHLADQSLRVRKGQLVAAGQPIGRVGRSGRASSDHLHFEVRLAVGRDEPWQKAEVLDPITFVSEHLPAPRPDASLAATYLEWAECAAMLESADRADTTLDRSTWWRMLARAARQSHDGFPDEPDGSRQMLVEEGVLDAGFAPSPAESLSWSELSRDLRRLKKVGMMVARPPVSPAAHRALCEREFSAARPTQALDQVGQRKAAPLLVDACVVLADLSSTWDLPKKKSPKKTGAPGPEAAPKPPASPRGVQASKEVDATPR
jgi:murein DD-endopeptidase MepM/ murein hydrolase activator NlpD